MHKMKMVGNPTFSNLLFPMDFICTCIHASDNVGFLAALTDKSEGLVLASEEKVGLIPKKFVFINKLDKNNYVN